MFAPRDTLIWEWASKIVKLGVRILLITMVFSVSAGVFAEMPEIPRGKGEFCVEPTDVMRRDHMNFLLHQRDVTVQDGIRTKKHSLVECINCHVQNNANGSFIPVNDKDQFCEVCHGFASVKLDCFECHRTTPDATVSSAMVNPPVPRINAMAFSASKIFRE